MLPRSNLAALLALPLLAAPVRLCAQTGGVPADSAAPPVAAAPPLANPAGPAAEPWLRVLPTVGGAQEEASRMAQLRGEAAADGFLLRSPSSMVQTDDRRASISVLAPEVLLAWNSRMPFSMLDGSLWAGRGGGTLVTAGVDVRMGPVRLIAAPEFVYSANAAFDTLVPQQWRQAESWYPDWQRNEHSIDLPWRMGDEAVSGIRAGQSSLTVTAGAVAFGAATENQWWGPGIRGALLLSNQAPGFGHLFVRTARPLRTPAGHVEARWVSGALRDSRFYAPAHGGEERGWRAFSGAALVVSPSRTLSLGVARSVYAPADDGMDAISRGALVFTRWDQIGRIYDDPSEQITSFFGRYLMPAAGMEVYAEWARTRLPINTRDLLELPEHSQGYTIGLQWLRAMRRGDLRLQAEHTYLEESPTYAFRQNGSWYASDQVPQGYTHEGQVLGSPVGPGGSGQWVAADWLRGRGRGGVFLSRVRWAQDAYYDQPGGFNKYLAYDISMFGGVRAAWALGTVRFDAEYALEHRWNIFFQSDAFDFTDRKGAVRARNHTLRLRFTADAPRLSRAN